MLRYEFKFNFNGQLIGDFPMDVAINEDEFYTGNIFDAYYKSIHLGHIRLVSVKPFPFFKLSDSISYPVMGKSAAQMGHYFKVHQGNAIKPDTRLALLVFEYVDRNFETQSDLFQDWWQNKKSQAYDNVR